MPDLEQKIKVELEANTTSVKSGFAELTLSIVQGTSAIEEQNDALRSQEDLRKALVESAERLARVEHRQAFSAPGGPGSGFGSSGGAQSGFSEMLNRITQMQDNLFGGNRGAGESGFGQLAEITSGFGGAAEGVATLGKASGGAAGMLGKLWNGLKTVANILPGLGIQGLIGGLVAGVVALYDALANTNALDVFTRGLSSMANEASRLGGNLSDALKSIKDMSEFLKGSRISEMGAEERAANDRNDPINAGIWGMRRNQLEGATSAAEKRKRADEQERLAGKMAADLGALAIQQADLDSRQAKITEYRAAKAEVDKFEAGGSTSRLGRNAEWQAALERQGRATTAMGFTTINPDVDAYERSLDPLKRQVGTYRQIYGGLDPMEALRNAAELRKDAESDMRTSADAAGKSIETSINAVVGKALKDNKLLVDARGSKINVRVDKISTDDPGQFASEALMGGFRGLVQHTIQADISAPSGR